MWKRACQKPWSVREVYNVLVKIYCGLWVYGAALRTEPQFFKYLILQSEESKS